jgi:serine-type D-Ala-D-Ala carboxypeptidase (penicillin-binding protein 5/6)
MNYWLKTSFCFLILLCCQCQAGLVVEDMSQPTRLAVGPVDPDDPGWPSCEADGICRVNECRADPDPDCPIVPTFPAFPTLTGTSAILVDRASGRVLGFKNPDLKWAPASTTKIMTGLLAVEAVAAGTVSLNDIVTIRVDVGAEGGGQIGLRRLDTISLRDLLHMALLSSENDAATAVGTYIAGSRPAFIAMMNTRAAQLGLSNTSYVDISGRDPQDFIAGCSGNEFNDPTCAHFTTARDLAALARVALNDPIFARIVRRTTWTTTTWRRNSGVPGQPATVLDVTLTTTNRLLRNTLPEFYPGAYGVKTGTSDQAGRNLVSAATSAQGDVIAVVLGSDPDGTATGDRFSDSQALLDFGL